MSRSSAANAVSAIDCGADVRSDQSRAECRRGWLHYAQYLFRRAIREDASYIRVCARARSAAAGRCEEAKRDNENSDSTTRNDGAPPCDLTSGEGSARWEKCLVKYYRGGSHTSGLEGIRCAQPCV